MNFDATSFILGAMLITLTIAISIAWSKRRAPDRAKQAASRPLLRVEQLRRQARELMFDQLSKQGQCDPVKAQAIVDFVAPMNADCLKVLLATPPGLYGYYGGLVLLESYFENTDGSCTHVSISTAYGEIAHPYRVRVRDLKKLCQPASAPTATYTAA